MTGAIWLIVDGYVRLKDRKALDDLCVQRRNLVADLNASTAIDCTGTIRQVEEDIVVIGLGWHGWTRQGRVDRNQLVRARPDASSSFRPTHQDLEQLIWQRPTAAPSPHPWAFACRQRVPHRWW